MNVFVYLKTLGLLKEVTTNNFQEHKKLTNFRKHIIMAFLHVNSNFGNSISLQYIYDKSSQF